MDLRKEQISWEDFDKIDLRIGTVIQASPNEHARKPSIILEIDFGAELGILKSSAQLTVLYQPKDLVGKQVVAVVNFPVIQVAKTMSQCLVLGALGDNGHVSLLQADRKLKNGLRIS